MVDRDGSHASATASGVRVRHQRRLRGRRWRFSSPASRSRGPIPHMVMKIYDGERSRQRPESHKCPALRPYARIRATIPPSSLMRLVTLKSFYLLDRAVTPGNSLPSSSSKLAPPPVETWLSLFSTPYLAATVAVSPPPIMTILPLCAACTAASMVALVPLANLSISNTPGGPFHKIVLASSMACL